MLRGGLGRCTENLTCGNGGGYVHGAQVIKSEVEIISETSTSDRELVCICELYVF